MDTNMMDAQLVGRIRNSATFQELEAKRNGFSWLLTFIMLAIYFAFILSVGFAPGAMSQRIGDSVVTWGFPFGIGVIVAAIALTGIYVWRANTVFDAMTRKIAGSVQ